MNFPMAAELNHETQEARKNGTWTQPLESGDEFVRRNAEVVGRNRSFSPRFAYLTSLAVLIFTVTVSAAPAGVAESANYLANVVAELGREWPSNRTVNIVCHGHSVPAGYAQTPEVRMLTAYPNRLHRALCGRFPHAVINVIVTGIGGENSESGAKRFERDVLALRPDVVTIDYALNDRAIGLKRAEAAWRSMITNALAHNVKVILLTPTPATTAKLDDPNDPLNQHAAQICRLAAEYHVALVDSLEAFRAKVKAGVRLEDLMAQSNHPNGRGHELVAAELLKWFPKE
jgi:lysophospholipase L1-like esterase